MFKNKTILIPFFIFITSNIIGVIGGILLLEKETGSASLLSKEITYQVFISYLSEILPKNTLILIIYIIIIPCLWLLKERIFKSDYTKGDFIVYHIANSIILVNTGIQLGYLMLSSSYNFDYTLFKLYILGVLPHGITEMLAFFIIYVINLSLINSKKYSKSIKINYKLYIFSLVLIFISAIIESTLTPFLLYNL